MDSYQEIRALFAKDKHPEVVEKLEQISREQVVAEEDMPDDMPFIWARALFFQGPEHYAAAAPHFGLYLQKMANQAIDPDKIKNNRDYAEQCLADCELASGNAVINTPAR